MGTREAGQFWVLFLIPGPNIIIRVGSFLVLLGDMHLPILNLTLVVCLLRNDDFTDAHIVELL